MPPARIHWLSDRRVAGFDRSAACSMMARSPMWSAVRCELLDRTFRDVARSGHSVTQGVPNDSEAVLLAEVEGNTAGEASEAARTIATLFDDAGATSVRVALDEPTEAEFWELRHA